MPTEDGSLTPEDMKIIRVWLDEKGTKPAIPCPVCGTVRWSVGNHIVSDYIGEFGHNNNYVPYVILWCANCAYSMRFGAVQIGLYKRDEAVQPSQEGPSTSQPTKG